jgi:hypothetical protein
MLTVALIGCSLAGTPAVAKGFGCGSAWGIVPTPDGGPLGNALYGVDGVATDDLWAVGTYFTDRALSLIARWDGSTWTVVSHPEKGDDSFLLGVSSVAGGDVWAVGYYHDQVGQKTLAFHWDGAAWSIKPTPNVGLESALTSVHAVASDDVWAVGFGIPQGGGETFTLAEHWDGAAWSVVATPPMEGVDASLSSVSASSADDAWAVGSVSGGIGDEQTLTEHWDGSSWTLVTSPSVPGFDNELHDVAADGPDDAWAVGSVSHSFTDARPLSMHWERTRWIVVPTRFARAGFDSVEVVAVYKTWAVGGGYGWDSVVEFWNGVRWSTIETPQRNRITLHAAVTFALDDTWAVGSRIDESGSVVHTVTEHHCPLSR